MPRGSRLNEGCDVFSTACGCTLVQIDLLFVYLRFEWIGQSSRARVCRPVVAPDGPVLRGVEQFTEEKRRDKFGPRIFS